MSGGDKAAATLQNPVAPKKPTRPKSIFIQRLTAILIAIIGSITTGCSGNAPQPPAAPEPAQSSQPTATAAKVETSTPVAAAASTPSPPVGDEQPANDSPVSTTSSATTCERIAVLTPDGPLLVDLSLSFDGHSLESAFDELVGQVLDAADTNNDDRPTWMELLSNEKYLADGAGYRQPITERQRKMLIERYDESRDGEIQRREALMWLGRDAQMSATPFSVRSDRTYSPNPRAASRVWQLIDTDGDGQLTAEELAAAPPRFWLFDADDDRVIVPGELASLREQLQAENPQMSGYTTTADTGRHAAIYLGPDFDVERLEFVLSGLYSPQQTIGVTSLGSSTRLFDALDENVDGWLEKQELTNVAKVEPQLKLAIDFKPPKKPYEPPATITLRSHAPEIALLAKAKDHLVVAFGRTQIRISAHDLAPMAESIPSIERSQVRVMVHDHLDAMFGEMDANSDGRLGEREIDACATRLLAKDTDGDGQLGADEASTSMIVAILRGERANEQSFYLPAVAARPPSEKAASQWFVRADFNRDGDISRREFLGSLDLFSQLDTNGDGFISAQEAAAFTAK